MLTAGQPAPNFTLPTDTGEPLALESLRGHWVVLYFYPRDNTPVCTAQSCAFRDQFPDFAGVDAIILGISTDGVESHARFRAKHHLPFTLLADTDAAVSRAYGALNRKSVLGFGFNVMERVTFVIDPAGNIAHVFRNVRVRGHAGEVLDVIRAGRAGK